MVGGRRSLQNWWCRQLQRLSGTARRILIKGSINPWRIASVVELPGASWTSGAGGARGASIFWNMAQSGA
eukprot:3807600-Lingulodinium_polyedra.AAC.1